MTRSGRYELLRLIARGGMAEVFLARRRTAGVEKLMVVKRIRPERAGDPRFLELFVREARLSTSLTHQNIVPVFDFGRAGELVFLAMERVEGKDLGAAIAKIAPLPPLLVAHIGAECCRALVYAHERKGPDGALLGVVHRDVTPRNVLLSWSGEVKLTDFGIASLSSDPAGALLGTPTYMAPEQARGEPIDVRADLYAVGLVLREAMTGIKARQGDDPLTAARANALPAWPDAANQALREVIDRATATAREDRFPDARAMLAALDDFIVSERAAHRGAAPEHQLAALLAAGFADEPPPPAFSPDETIEFEPDEAIGTRTEHSLARTRSEIIAPPPVAKRRRWPYVPIGLALAAGAAYLAWPRDHAAPIAPPPSPPIAHAASVPAPPPAPPVAIAAPPPPPPRVIHPRVVQVAPPDAPVVVTQRATINATPWAYFTVDGQDARHTTVETLVLPVGEHHLHFWNPALGVERDATIQVEADRELRYVVSLR